MTMDDNHTYLIQLRGALDIEELNAISPLEMQVIKADLEVTSLTVHTDQSGLIGLLRHLHARGFVLLSISAHHKQGMKKSKRG